MAINCISLKAKINELFGQSKILDVNQSTKTSKKKKKSFSVNQKF
jgi:hypothetical protein